MGRRGLLRARAGAASGFAPVALLMAGAMAPAMAGPAGSSTTEGGAVHPPAAGTAPGPAAGLDSGGAVFVLILAAASAASVGALWRRGFLRRGAFTPARRGVDVASAPAWLAGAGGVFVMAMLGASLAAGVIDAEGADAGLRETAVTTLAGGAGGLLGAAVALAMIAPGGARGAGFRIGWLDALRAAGALLLALPVVWLLVWAGSAAQAAFDGAPSDPLGHETLRAMEGEPFTAWWWAMAVVVTLVTPAYEEVLHRGFVQSALARATGSGWTAILLTSAVFALSHVGAADARTLPGLFALSVALGVAFERTGRLGVSYGMHAMFNGLNVVMAL